LSQKISRNVSNVTSELHGRDHLMGQREARPVMENFSKRTTATLAAVFLLGVLGWSFTLEKMGQAAMPVAPYAHHLVFTPIGKA
jgi:preprotein translocase subunit SecG